MKSVFAKQDVLAACAQYGAQLNVSTLNGSALATALASNESSLGANCGPRHEPAYDVGGSVYTGIILQKTLVARWGAAAACSYGPWQMMFSDFLPGTTPDELYTRLDLLGAAFVQFFNSYVVGMRHALTVDAVGQVWNAGHVSLTPSPTVKVYVQHLQEAYAQAIAASTVSGQA